MRRARSVFVTGNDGSGKSTFANRLRRRATARGMRVGERRYYGSLVRRSFRGLIELLTSASQRKVETAAPTTTGQDAPSSSAAQGAPRQERKQQTGLRRVASLAFLWAYQTAIGIETRLRDWFSCNDLEIIDRSFIDDLVSISQTLRVEIPLSLLRYSCALFPTRRLYYLSAGHDVEYGRIVEMDLSAEFHRAKGERYAAMIAQLEPGFAPLRRISTASRPGGVRAVASKTGDTGEEA
jgi:hypothetical protein